MLINFALNTALFLYGLIYDTRILWLMIGVIALYLFFANVFYYHQSAGSGRKRLALALWDPPREGLIHSKLEVDVSKVQAYLQSSKAKEAHVTLTHVCIRAIAEILNAGRNTCNGKIVFGKFIPYDTVDVSCLINVGNGEDLAAVLVSKADEKTFEDIAEFIGQRAAVAKKGQDQEHKARSGPLKFFPPFIIRLVIELTSFLTYNLGVTIKPLSLKRHCFGAATVTSLGAFGFRDVFVPFTPMMRNSFIVAINQVVQKPVVKEGKIEIAPMLNLNFTLDHRFMDGGSVLKSHQAFWDVFEHPEKYCRKG